MEWHIVTASKGGVGKTLITLLLLAYYLEEKADAGILVLDLNAMNTDTSAMLLVGGGNIDKPFPILLPKTKRKIWIRKAHSENNDFVVAWSADPFLLYGRTEFAELLAGIKENVTSIEEELGKPLRYVIVDTNYHFCNLFPPQDEQYENEYWKNLKSDEVTVWFIWVYRQLMKIVGAASEEITLVTSTAGAIERFFKSESETSTSRQRLGPLVHTYTPVGLLPTDSESGTFLSKFFGGKSLPVVGQDYPIPDLAKVEKLEKVGKYIMFLSWIKKLMTAYTAYNDPELKTTEEDKHQLFGKVLRKTVQNISDEDQLPINIFPLSLYEVALAGYTDKERGDTIVRLRELDTYKNFRKLLRRKLGDT